MAKTSAKRFMATDTIIGGFIQRDTPPGAKPFPDLRTDTEWLKEQKKKKSAARKKATAKAKKK